MKEERGFIALISVLIISVTLLGAVISLAQYGIMNRYALLYLEHKAASYSLAEACVERARILVVNNPDYNNTTPETKNVSGATPILGNPECTIHSVLADNPSAGESWIRTTAEWNDARTNLSVQVDQDTGNITYFKELPAL